MWAKFDQNERIVPIASGRSKSSANVRRVGRPASARLIDALGAHDRHGQNGTRCARRRPGPARAAAAVRNRKRLVQVEVHEVEAHVARAAVAHQRVGVRAVVVHQAAGRVHGAAISWMWSSNSPSVFGLVIMQTAVSGRPPL
jgi:hypothetical protein